MTTTTATIENLMDVYGFCDGRIVCDGIRCVEMADAVVDLGSTFLGLPTASIAKLGLIFVGRRMAAVHGMTAEYSLYEAVRLTICDRSCSMDVIELPHSSKVLIGQLALTHLDLVVDNRQNRLIGNPAHDGVHTYEMYHCQPAEV